MIRLIVIMVGQCSLMSLMLYAHAGQFTNEDRLLLAAFMTGFYMHITFSSPGSYSHRLKWLSVLVLVALCTYHHGVFIMPTNFNEFMECGLRLTLMIGIDHIIIQNCTFFHRNSHLQTIEKQIRQLIEKIKARFKKKE